MDRASGESQLKRLKKPWLALVAGVGLLVVGFVYLQGGPLRDRMGEDGLVQRLEQMERALHKLRAAMNVDSVRQYNIQRITAVIERYNPPMAANQRYEIASTIYELTLQYTNLDLDLLCATITHETANTWDLRAVSPAGAMGLMQVMPITGMLVARYEGITWTTAEEILFDPVYNLRIGARFLSSLIMAYGIEGGLAAYNGGERRAALWLASGKAEEILHPETASYVPSVIDLYESFRGES